MSRVLHAQAVLPLWTPGPRFEGKRLRANQPALLPRPAKTGRPRAGAALLALILVALPLSGCGKKGPPNPPPGVPNTYPRSYPRE